MKVETVFLGDRRIHAVETHDGKVLIFRPDASGESSLARSRQRCDVKDDTTDLAKKFASNIFELIGLAIKSLGIDENHAQENFRGVGGVGRAADVRDRIERVKRSLLGGQQGMFQNTI